MKLIKIRTELLKSTSLKLFSSFDRALKNQTKLLKTVNGLLETMKQSFLQALDKAFKNSERDFLRKYETEL